jgi:hypothetical protein
MNLQPLVNTPLTLGLFGHIKTTKMQLEMMISASERKLEEAKHPPVLKKFDSFRKFELDTIE